MYYQPGFQVNQALQPVLQAPTMPNIQSAQPVITQGPQLIQVNGIESAKAFQTVANSTVALFDSNEDIMYIKSTDASNFPVIRKFRFTEIKEENIEKKVDPKYVTFEEFERSLKELREEIQNGKQFVQPTNESRTTESSNSKYIKPNNAGKGNNATAKELQ